MAKVFRTHRNYLPDKQEDSMYRPFAALLAAGMVFFSLPASRGDDKKERLEPINLEKLNTDKDEDDPHLATNGIALYYSVGAKGKYEVFGSLKKGKTWGPGKALPDLKGKADYRSVFVSTEGVFPQYLYFATNQDPLKQNRGDNYDIYFYIKQFHNADWTTKTALRVCTARDEMHPWLTKDGTALYFSRKDKDGWRLYVTRRPGGAGQFNDEQNVGFPVGFHHATITPDGKTMYLQGPLEKDRWGLFRSKLEGKAWSKPEPLDDLNDPEAPTGDRSPNLSRDGSALFFASDREGGKGGLDIWMIPTAKLGKGKDKEKDKDKK
jgi:hypothetical protein